MISLNTQNGGMEVKIQSDEKDSNTNRDTVHKVGVVDANPTGITTINVNDHIKLNVLNANCKLNVFVEYYEPSIHWYRDFFKKYKDRLWERTERNGGTNKTKYYYRCKACDRKLSTYSTLRMHLNKHMNFKPYSCEKCGKRFADRSALAKCRLRHSKLPRPNMPLYT